LRIEIKSGFRCERAVKRPEMKKKILVIRYRFIGDTVLTIPFLRNLRYNYPDAQIDMLVGPVSGDVLLDCPYIDNLIYFDTTKKHKYENTGEEKKSFFTYVKLLKEQNYDKAYVLKRSFSSALLAFMAGIKERIGFSTEGRGFLLTKSILYVKNRHEIECFLDVLRADGKEIKDDYLENWISPKSEDKINDILAKYDLEGQKKVLIHATSGNVNKQWPNENFAKIIEFLSNVKNARVFFTGTAKDSDVYTKILKQIPEKLNIEPINLCGELSIQDSTALINKMDFIIGSDSGTLHIAASLNIPVIGIYGPMNPKKWRAWGEIHKPVFLDMPCIPCDLKKEFSFENLKASIKSGFKTSPVKNTCPQNYACIKNISPEKIIEEAKSLLG